MQSSLDNFFTQIIKNEVIIIDDNEETHEEMQEETQKGMKKNLSAENDNMVAIQQ